MSRLWRRAIINRYRGRREKIVRERERKIKLRQVLIFDVEKGN